MYELIVYKLLSDPGGAFVLPFLIMTFKGTKCLKGSSIEPPKKIISYMFSHIFKNKLRAKIFALNFLHQLFSHCGSIKLIEL